MHKKPDLPDGIGPHEGRELELMLSGKKPLAMYTEVLSVDFEWPDSDFEPHVITGEIIKREYSSQTPDGRHTVRHLYFSLPDEELRIDEAHALSLKKQDALHEQSESDSARIGKLLGYSADEIQSFIDWIRIKRPTQK
jgi:hypothetical protein